MAIQYPRTREFQQALNEGIADLRDQLKALLSEVPATSGETLRGGAKRKEAPPSQAGEVTEAQTMVQALDERLGRLERVRDWIEEDDDMAQFIDSILSKQYKALERRLARSNIVQNIVFLFAGWVLSLVGTPLNIFQWLQTGSLH